MKWGDQLAKEQVLKTPEIIAAFNKVDRYDFLPDDSKDLVEFDRPVSIGYGQTISAPLVVGQMLEWLKPSAGQLILDVGCGSGWTTALLAHIVGKKGRVIGVERIEELVKFGRNNANKYDSGNIEIHPAEHGVIGWPSEQEYDRILVSAAAHKDVVDKLAKQLKEDGILVVPLAEQDDKGYLGQSIHVYTKKKSSLEDLDHPGYIFVPLIDDSPTQDHLYGE